jgi:hypothetical protein
MCVKCSSPNTKGIARKIVASPSHLHHGIKSTEAAGSVEAFRPTTPGHSPGVGHSVGN